MERYGRSVEQGLTSFFRNNMSFILHSRKSRKVVEKMIKNHVNKMRKTYSWDGEHEEITKEIFDFLRWGKKNSE